MLKEFEVWLEIDFILRTKLDVLTALSMVLLTVLRIVCLTKAMMLLVDAYGAAEQKVNMFYSHTKTQAGTLLGCVQ